MDKLAALFTLPPKEERLEGWFVFTATLQGMLKKTSLEELPGPTGHSFTLVKVIDEDKLGWVRLTDGQAEILLVTADGMAIRFHEDAVRPMGLVAAGVVELSLVHVTRSLVWSSFHAVGDPLWSHPMARPNGSHLINSHARVVMVRV